MSATSDLPDKMLTLQKLRIRAVIGLTQENAMLLSLRQKLAGKEIEVMVAERNASEGLGSDGPTDGLEQVYAEHDAAKAVLEMKEADVLALERALAGIDSDIAKLCQS